MGEIIKSSKMHLSTLPTSYVVVDTETTGLDPETCDLVEVSALKVIDLVPTESFSTLVHCDRINRDAERINGITADMLQDAPSADEAVAKLIEFCDDLPLMAYNAKFDKAFVEKVRAIPNPWLDAMQLASSVTGRRQTLSSLCERYGIENENAHRALSDCRATHACYLKMRVELAGTSTDARDIVADASNADPDGPLYGKRIVFTGDTEPSSRHLAMQAIADAGGIPANGVTLKTDYLVILSEYDEPTTKMKKAAEYAERDDCGIEIIRKDEFCALLGGDVGELISNRQSDSEKLDLSTSDGWKKASRKREGDSDNLPHDAPELHDADNAVKARRRIPVMRFALTVFLMMFAIYGLTRFELNISWMLTEALFLVPAALILRSGLKSMRRNTR